MTNNPVPTPPFWGTRCIEQIPLKALLPYINRTTLYKFQWGFKPQGRKVEEYKDYARENCEPILKRLVEASEAQGVLRPQAIYGYFSCNAEGDELVVYAAPDSREELCRFPFPRQTTERRLC
ncbi:MAG: methionine synthase, partial [Betaproteobacteria bacterium]|nr:methionine synthase [Betaproteobacteria bacterium]